MKAHEVVQTPIEALRPAAANARVHSKKQLKQIARSIQRYGFNAPVLVGDDGEIIAGHGRIEAAKLLGLDTVPTICLAHLNEIERRAYCRTRGIEFDWDIHPDDVQFDARTGEIYILGPLNAEEREAVKFVTDSLEFLHKAAEEAAERVRENPRRKKTRIALGLHIELIESLNAQLPPRLQREVDADIRALAIVSGC